MGVEGEVLAPLRESDRSSWGSGVSSVNESALRFSLEKVDV
jgi:hypothetical protein